MYFPLPLDSSHCHKSHTRTHLSQLENSVLYSGSADAVAVPLPVYSGAGTREYSQYRVCEREGLKYMYIVVVRTGIHVVHYTVVMPGSNFPPTFGTLADQYALTGPAQCVAALSSGCR